jgi:hypothetical protein
MQINRKLNLVIPIQTETEGEIFVHSVPIGRELFEKYYSVIGRTFKIIMERFGITAAPRLSYLTLREVSQELGVWEGADGVKSGLINEIQRLTNVMFCTPDNGWQTFPLTTYCARKEIDEDTLSEIMGELCFFTCVCKMNKKDAAEGILQAATGIWGSQISSLDSTAYLASLRTLIKVESIGEQPSTLLVAT